MQKIVDSWSPKGVSELTKKLEILENSCTPFVPQTANKQIK